MLGELLEPVDYDGEKQLDWALQAVVTAADYDEGFCWVHAGFRVHAASPSRGPFVFTLVLTQLVSGQVHHRLCGFVIADQEPCVDGLGLFGHGIAGLASLIIDD